MKRFPVVGMLAIALIINLVGSGCALNKQLPDVPPHDEVLHFPLAFDLVYLRTLEALENAQGWELEETEKEKGIITVRNLNFSRLDDSDMLYATFWLKREDRNLTSVELAPISQRVQGGDFLMKQIKNYVSREM